MLRILPVAALVIAIIGIAGCGGGGGDSGAGTMPLSNAEPVPGDEDDVSQPVQVAYEGTTLVVRAVRYERAGGIELCSPIAVCENGVMAYAPGQVIVSFSSANALRATALVTSLGLSVDSVGNNTLVINVPVLYERQWVRALRQEAVFASADVNGIVRAG